MRFSIIIENEQVGDRIGRTAEMVLGILGGIFGILGGILLIVGGILSFTRSPENKNED